MSAAQNGKTACTAIAGMTARYAVLAATQRKSPPFGAPAADITLKAACVDISRRVFVQI